MVALRVRPLHFLTAALAEKSPIGLNLQTGLSRGSNVGAKELPGLTRLSQQVPPTLTDVNLEPQPLAAGPLEEQAARIAGSLMSRLKAM